MLSPLLTSSLGKQLGCKAGHEYEILLMRPGSSRPRVAALPTTKSIRNPDQGMIICRVCRRLLIPEGRYLSTTAASRSGHNRWSKIKHDKAKEDVRLAVGKSEARMAHIGSRPR